MARVRSSPGAANDTTGWATLRVGRSHRNEGDPIDPMSGFVAGVALSLAALVEVVVALRREVAGVLRAVAALVLVLTGFGRFAADVVVTHAHVL